MKILGLISKEKVKVIKIIAVIVLCVALSLSFSSIPELETRAAEITSDDETIEYELVPLEDTETNNVYYLCSNNNGTYTYYYIGFNGIDYYYQRGTIETEAELTIKPLPDYISFPKIVKSVNYINQEEHVSYTVYAPIDNVFEFKLDSGAQTSIK